MFNNAKCPACGKNIINVTFEKHEPSILKGGSLSYLAVAQCGHTIGAVPMIWESYIQNIQKIGIKQNQEIQNLKYQIDNIQNTLNILLQNMRR
jgi:hypothetical protein